MRIQSLMAVLMFAGLASVPTPLLAQSSPEAVAEAYVAAIRMRGLPAAVDYIHPDELRRFKDMLSPLFAQAASPTAQSLARAVFGPLTSVEAVARMDPASFMRGFMGFLDGQLKALETTIGDVRILGAVREGDTVHLVTRNSAGAAGVQFTKLEVMSLKPYQDTWRLLLSGEMEGLAHALNAKAAGT